MARRRRRHAAPDPAEQEFVAACRHLEASPLFRPLFAAGATVRRGEYERLRGSGWADVTTHGVVRCDSRPRGEAAEWVWVIAHCLLHLGFGHLGDRQARDPAAAAAACLVVDRFLREVKLGRPPVLMPDALPSTEEESLAERWRDGGIPPECAVLGTAGPAPDTVAEPLTPWDTLEHLDWPRHFAVGLAEAATAAVDLAGGARSPDGRPVRQAPWDRALAWFIASYPLLGALAARFTLVADVELARGWNISVAAVNADVGEIYLNPLRRLSEPEWRFVLAHEMLHAALRHGDRVGPRDPYLWNVAADFVVNGWLLEMGVGVMPEGLLHDPELAGLSVEAVYDRIATDLRRYRKLATLRGAGLGDVLGEPLPRPGEERSALDLDAYYRRALATGLAYHESQGRGLLPGGLVEEIRVLDQPPLPWDAQLARWFDEHVRAPEKRRSYARPSRRQAATPGIPRPGWVRPAELTRRTTFGVVLDTSGSMDRQLLGKALGAIASFALSRDVPAARVVFCDAVAYDAGYLDVAEIAGRVRIRGRGGTVLQPGVQLLERAEDFPADGPILVITDAACDVVRIRREHAFLVPEGAQLPFTPRGPVFRLR